jgi:TATA-box binding protein (TBP) (component of TFIID and TFIIIB)
MDYKITNVKISVKSAPVCLDTVIIKLKEKNICHQIFSNYVVIQETYTYVIFKQNKKGTDDRNHINITKISSLDKIEHAKKLLQKFIHVPFYYTTTIDNITVSMNLNKCVIPDEIINSFKDLCKITFNQETFPGVFLKFKYGTAIVFHTGKCVMIGCKSEESIQKIVHIIRNNI